MKIYILSSYCPEYMDTAINGVYSNIDNALIAQKLFIDKDMKDEYFEQNHAFGLQYIITEYIMDKEIQGEST